VKLYLHSLYIFTDWCLVNHMDFTLLNTSNFATRQQAAVDLACPLFEPRPGNHLELSQSLHIRNIKRGQGRFLPSPSKFVTAHHATQCFCCMPMRIVTHQSQHCQDDVHVFQREHSCTLAAGRTLF